MTVDEYILTEIYIGDRDLIYIEVSDAFLGSIEVDAVMFTRILPETIHQSKFNKSTYTYYE
jgi:hypothetical protein